MSHSFKLLVALVPLALACKSSQPPAASDCSAVLTPAGPRPKACVHEVPNGSLVSVADGGTTIVTVDGRVVATYPPCTCAPLSGETADSGGPAHSDAVADTAGFVDGGVSTDDAPSAGDATAEAGRELACRGPLADAGVTSPSDLSTDQACAESRGRIIRWTNLCHGSIVVVRGEGVDCSTYWLFDASTQALQATAHGCNGGNTCTGAVAGFPFPSDCFDGNFATDVVSLCRLDGGGPLARFRPVSAGAGS